MANHPIHHNSHRHDASFTTPTALMLDTRLTPLERNGWQVLHMLRAADGTSPLANLGQYLLRLDNDELPPLVERFITHLHAEQGE